MFNSSGLISRLLGVPYTPHPEDRGFLARQVVQHDGDVAVLAAVLDGRESARYFGIPVARKGIQPIWLQITAAGPHSYRLRLASIDPNYFPPLEAASICHFRMSRRILQFGLMALIFTHLLLLLPFKLLSARRANRLMDQFFVEHSIGWGLVRPGQPISGFVYASLQEGTRHFNVRLINRDAGKDFEFSIPVPGLHVDHRGRDLVDAAGNSPTAEYNDETLRTRLLALPPSTKNRNGTRQGDPLNLVVIGDFENILASFGGSWDETEAISLRSCWRTMKAFALGQPYPYSPVSSLFFEGRSQDFALQRARETINERLHLRLWLTPMRLGGKPVWVGQVSRDIGVRFTWQTWNLTTHRIDPDVDDARDYVMDYLLEGGRVSRIGFTAGVGRADSTEPRHNLTGDPYFTDGQRAVAVVADTQTTPTFLSWT